MHKTWDETFMSIAREIALRSHCLQVQIGAVIANMNAGEQTILSFGYNGPPRGVAHCDELHLCHNRDEVTRNKKPNGYSIGAHAEVNAMINAARNGVSIEGAWLFSTCSPCMECAKHILNSGIACVVFLEYYATLFPDKQDEDARAIKLLQSKKICYQFGSGTE